jgi:hypothetical protein
MTLSLGSVASTASSLLDTLTGGAQAAPAANPTQATATTPAKAHHGGHHHGGSGGTQSFSDILSALTNPTSPNPTSTGTASSNITNLLG